MEENKGLNEISLGKIEMLKLDSQLKNMHSLARSKKKRSMKIVE